MSQSYLTLLGNLFLSPLITIFMLLSSVLFFAELLGLQTLCLWTSATLELLCSVWHKIMAIWTSNPTFHISINQGLIIFGFAVILLIILTFHKTSWSKKLLALYLFLSIAVCRPMRVYVENSLHNNSYKKLKFRNGHLFASRNQQGDIKIWNETKFNKFNRKSGFLDFDLKPALAREFGKVEFEVAKN